MNNHCLLFVLFISITFSNAQQGINSLSSGGYDYAFLDLKNDDDSQIKGSKYLTENFNRAGISDFEDKVFAVRYDVFNDQMEFQGGNNQIYIMSKDDRARKITFLDTNNTYSIHDYISDENLTRSGYFVSLNSDSKYKILKKNKIVFIEEKASATGYDAPHPATYKKIKDRHYISISNEPAILVDTNKKRFSSIFIGQEKEVLGFIKKNKIKLSNDNDLLSLVEFMNTK